MSKLTPIQRQIKNEMRVLSSRLTGMEGVTKMMIRVQIERYAQAERLRITALNLVRGHLKELADALKGLKSFKMPRVPAWLAKKTQGRKEAMKTLNDRLEVNRSPSAMARGLGEDAN